MNHELHSLMLANERDVVSARQRARLIAETLGFDHHDQIRIATAVSEIARNAFRYARGGAVSFTVDQTSLLFLISVTDQGGGIPHLDEVLGGSYRSKTGMGMGLLGNKASYGRLLNRNHAARNQGTVRKAYSPRRWSDRCRNSSASLGRVEETTSSDSNRRTPNTESRTSPYPQRTTRTQRGTGPAKQRVAGHQPGCGRSLCRTGRARRLSAAGFRVKKQLPFEHVA